jgi:hypothetical protein
MVFAFSLPTSLLIVIYSRSNLTTNRCPWFLCLFKSHIKKSGQIFIVNMDSFVIRAAKPNLTTIGATVHSHYGKILYKGDRLVAFLFLFSVWLQK